MKRFLLLAVCLASFATIGPAARARDIFKVYPEPKIERYDWKRDDFIRRESVLTPPRRKRSAYGVYRNRLQRFQFLGPPEQSGIYGSLEEYQRERNLDPAKYE